MNVHTEDLPGCRVAVTLQFDVNDVQAAFGKVYKDLNRQGQVPGFRPGKTPRALLVRHYGEDTISGMAKYELIANAVEDAVKDLDLIEPPQLPDLEELEVAENRPLEVSFTATVGPRVTIGDLSDIEIIRPSPEVSEEDIAGVLSELQESEAEEVKPDRDVVAPGDVVDLELEITLEGHDEPITELEETVRVGQGAHFPPIDDKLIGRIVGQTIEMDVTYPDDYHDETLAGYAASIRARIAALRELRLPPLDDNLARAIDADLFENLDDLRKHIRDDLERRYAQFSRTQVETQVVDALLERCDADLPEAMLRQALGDNYDEIMDAVSRSAEQGDAGQGAEDADDALVEQELVAHLRERLAADAIIAELAEQHGVEVGEEDLQQQAEIYAADNDLDLSYVMQAAAVQPDFSTRLEYGARRRKVVEAIVAAANVRDVSRDDYVEQRAASLEAKATQETPPQESAEAADDGAERAPAAAPHADEQAMEQQPHEGC